MNFNHNTKNLPFRTLSDIAGMHVTIMGLGLHGGGLASARFFAKHGAIVTVTDLKTESELAPSLACLNDFPQIRYVLGKHEINDFKQANLVIKNPGIKRKGNKYLDQAPQIETDLSVFLSFNTAPVIAITGSKGKSTTASAIHFVLKNLGYASYLGGNITISPLHFLEELITKKKKSIVTLELSSWQLADLQGRGLLKPKIACITPIMADHQNWYTNMESYVADKKIIYSDLDAKSYLLCNFDDTWGQIFAQETKSKICWYSTEEYNFNGLASWLEKDGRGFMRIPRSKTNYRKLKQIEILPSCVAVPGKHNRQNLLIAATVLAVFGCKPKSIKKIIATFPGIEHRLEFFHTAKGISFYNDSAATIPEASILALKAFSTPVILLAGGTDKDLDFRHFVANAQLAKHIFLLDGTATVKLIPLLQEKNIPFSGPYASLKALVQAAVLYAKKQDIIVFSPGATSFGMFANEFDRGKQFKETVLLLTQ